MNDSALWVELGWEGQDEDAPFTLPDGRDLYRVIEDGPFASIADRVWLEVSNPGTTGDVLWTTGMAFTVVSGRFLEALPAAGARNVEAFPLTIRRKRAADVEGYHLVVVHGEDPNLPVRGFPNGRRSTPWLDVHVDVLAELRRRGIDGFEVEDARELSEGLAAEADDGSDPVNRDDRLWEAYVEEPAAGAAVLRLRVEDGNLSGQFQVPAGRLSSSPQGSRLREDPDGCWSALATDGSVVYTLSRPIAVDASGTPVASWWYEDGNRIHLNVDHLPGVHTYPVTVEATLR
ncbi:hypothetical protein [Citricoccus sp. CH26A]|uniref:hypothetical protein n=1 Tax=Citricoccus sp. CH26A TaxID=1045009 RepID=UPI001ED9151B|nr:hypothetical protein [Citricoccus sp. CH26A]